MEYNFAVVKIGALFIPFILLSMLLIVSCDEAIDAERPVVSILSPLDGATASTADGIQISASITDNGELLQYKIVVSGIDSLNGIAKDSTLRMVIIGGLSGSQFDFNETINLPDSTFNGFYNVIFTCLDNEGNQASSDTISLRIVNDLDSVPPVFNIGGLPALADTLRLGQGFTLSGGITDETSLNSVTLRIKSDDGTYTVYVFDFTVILDNTVNLEGNGGYFLVDTNWAEGPYTAYFTAWDSLNGVDHSIPFYVKFD